MPPAPSSPRRPQNSSRHAPAASSRPRRPWWRTALALLRLLLVIAIPAGIAWFAYDNRDFLRSPDSPFRITHISVTTDGALDTAQILAAAQVSTNISLFACDPAEIRTRLERHHMVASAVVTRQFPNTLRLDVFERVPLARIAILNGSPSLTIDREGHVMGPTSANVALPLIIGLNDRALIPGDVSRDPLLPDLVAIIQAIAAPDLRDLVSVRALDIRDRGRIRLVLASGEEVLLSTKNYIAKLHQLPIIRGVAKERGLTFHTYDMTVDRSFPAY